MLGGTYTPRVRLVGNDVYGSPYQVEFNAGSNSVSVSDVEIMRVTAPSIVSRGDTFEVDVRIKNGGGSVVSVNDIVPRYGHGYFGVTGAWNPPLPDNLPAGAERDYRRSMYVFTNSPLGADTIDASVTASVDGSQVQDASAYPNVAPIFVQSAASIAYVSGSLSPGVVSKGQSHGFALSLRNDGQAAVILSGSATWFSFTDGVDTLRVVLGADGALPGGATTNIVFPSTAVPLAMDAGNWPVSVRLRGTENGGSFSQTHRSGRSRSRGRARESRLPSRFHRADAGEQEERRRIRSGNRQHGRGDGRLQSRFDLDQVLLGLRRLYGEARRLARHGRRAGRENALLQRGDHSGRHADGEVPPDGAREGRRKRLAFSANLVSSDSIAVQSPSQLAIASTTVFPSDSVTADQAKEWFASIRVDNNGGAAVRLDSLAVRLYAGSQEVTSQCILTPLNFNPHVDVLDGGEGTNHRRAIQR